MLCNLTEIHSENATYYHRIVRCVVLNIYTTNRFSIGNLKLLLDSRYYFQQCVFDLY